MTRQKVLLVLAAAAFLGWIGYLGYAVAYHRLNPPDVVSRSQLAGAKYVVVAEVKVEDGKPSPQVKVVQRLRHRDEKDDDNKDDNTRPTDTGPKDGDTITVDNLPAARPPSDGPFPGPDKYLLFLVPEGFRNGVDAPVSYRIAGWPRSPGVEGYEPGQELKYLDKDADGKPVVKSYNPPRYIRPPLVYPWNEGVKAQMRKLGYQI